MPRSDGNLDPRAGRRKLADTDRGPGWPLIPKVGNVHRVHALEEVHIGEIDLDRDDIFIVHLRLAKNDTDAVQRLMHFGFEIFRHFAGLQVASGLAGHVQGAINEDPGAERSAGGKLFRLNDLLLGAQERRAEQSNCSNICEFHTYSESQSDCPCGAAWVDGYHR